ncbi:MAG TPA: glycosyltransferase family 39 protein, partial [Planctomycetota bacterium]|nr:glycosyltransferase family 39 protein [Planctomycetota bacterium]
MPTAPSTIAPPPRPRPPAPRIRERELPRPFERATLSILALATLLLAWSWSRVEGYQIADSVEYLERAHSIVLGVPMIDSQAIRSFGFSGLFIPLFALARIFGRYGPMPQAANVLQIALVLALLVVTMRLAARLAGRRAGYAAGLLLLASPAVLRWGVTPISGIAAALFVALALSELIGEERSQRPAMRGLVAGLWLGAALLMAYQTVMVIAPILAVVLLRRERRGFRPALVCGVLACVLLQCFLDLAYYGRFGASLGYYVLENFGSNFAMIVYHAGDKLHARPLMNAGQWLYNELGRAAEIDYAVQEEAKGTSQAIRSMQPRTWYLENLAQGVPWAAAALVAAGF